MVDWFVTTLRSYPELAIFFALAIGFTVEPLKFAGFSLGNVTATLIAAVIIGQLGITVSPIATGATNTSAGNAAIRCCSTRTMTRMRLRRRSRRRSATCAGCLGIAFAT